MQELSVESEEVKPKSKKTVLDIVLAPDPILSQKSELILGDFKSDEYIQNLLMDMTSTMQAFNAVGLAAVQVGVPVRAIVVQNTERKPIQMINPVIKKVEGSMFVSEACLSFPTVFVRLARPMRVTVDYYDLKGQAQTLDAEGLMAQAIYHECLHLDGITILDEVGSFQRRDLLNKVKKFKRQLKKFR